MTKQDWPDAYEHAYQIAKVIDDKTRLPSFMKGSTVPTIIRTAQL